MTGPGGIQTKRDQRRESRRGQFQQRQLERQRARQAEIRRQRTIRYASLGGGLVVFLLVMGLIIHAVTSGGSPSTMPKANGPHQQYTTPATGETREGMQCLTSEGATVHVHAYFAVYADGKQQNIPADIGYPGSCIYALHTHDGTGIIHLEAPDNNAYTLGQFYSLWGKPLSATQVGDLKTDATHALKVVVFDSNGKQVAPPSDPWNIQIKAHESIYILYNSPHVTPTPYTNWGDL